MVTDASGLEPVCSKATAAVPLLQNRAQGDLAGQVAKAGRGLIACIQSKP
jgi:hypothetical protein